MLCSEGTFVPAKMRSRDEVKVGFSLVEVVVERKVSALCPSVNQCLPETMRSIASAYINDRYTLSSPINTSDLMMPVPPMRPNATPHHRRHHRVDEERPQKRLYKSHDSSLFCCLSVCLRPWVHRWRDDNYHLSACHPSWRKV